MTVLVEMQCVYQTILKMGKPKIGKNCDHQSKAQKRQSQVDQSLEGFHSVQFILVNILIHSSLHNPVFLGQTLLLTALTAQKQK